MNELLTPPIWVALLFALTLLVFAVPLLPALLASRSIKSLGAMFIDADDDGSAVYAASLQVNNQGSGTVPLNVLVDPKTSASYGPDADINLALSAENIYVKRCTNLHSVVTAQRILYVEEGCTFSWLDAPSICFGHSHSKVVSWNARMFTLKLFSPYSGGRFERFEGDQTIENGKVITGDRLVTGDLQIGDGCTLVGSLKVYGHVSIGAGSSIKGSIFSEKSVELGAQSFVSGVISANDIVRLGNECVVGTTEQLSSVSARKVQAAAGAVVHGGIRARDSGYFPISGSSI
jgi:hypothetical protein